MFNLQSKLYDQQVAALKANNESLEQQNKLLSMTSFDRAATLIKGQKEVYEAEHEQKQKEIEALEKQGAEKAKEVLQLKAQLAEISSKTDALDQLSSKWALYYLNWQKTQKIPSVDDYVNAIIKGVPPPTGSPSPTAKFWWMAPFPTGSPSSTRQKLSK
jgi:predicted RNase H-like nuclease (RuvC/YqgF family)